MRSKSNDAGYLIVYDSGCGEELLLNDDVDGLHLDYIRYPDAGDFTNDSICADPCDDS